MRARSRALLASENHGHPAIAATSKPGEFTGKGVVAAREAKPSATPPRANPTNTGALGKTEPAGKEHATRRRDPGQTAEYRS